MAVVIHRCLSIYLTMARYRCISVCRVAEKDLGLSPYHGRPVMSVEIILRLASGVCPDMCPPTSPETDADVGRFRGDGMSCRPPMGVRLVRFATSLAGGDGGRHHKVAANQVDRQNRSIYPTSSSVFRAEGGDKARPHSSGAHDREEPLRMGATSTSRDWMNLFNHRIAASERHESPIP